MGYNSNGINNGIINTKLNHALNTAGDMGIAANSNYGVGGAENLGESKETGKSGTISAGVDFASSDKGKKNGIANSVMENFQEYMVEKQEKAKVAGEDQATKEREAREQAKEISQNISSEELRQLRLMGFDVETANMTDLMGMVNTLRYNAEAQETAELMAKIAMDKGDVSGVTMIGGAVTVGGTEVSGVSVGDVLVAEAKPENTAEAAEKENSHKAISEVAPETAERTTTSAEIRLSDNEAIYLLKNNKELSKENIYKAHFSGVKPAPGLGTQALSSMEPQLNKVIEQAGYEVSQETMEATKLLVNNDIPVTTDNLRKYMNMKQYMGQTPEEAGIPEKVAAMTYEELNSKAAKLYEDIKSIDVKQVYQMSVEGKTVTIAAAVKFGQLGKGGNHNGGYEAGQESNLDSSNSLRELLDGQAALLSDEELKLLGFTDSKSVTAMRQMEELRLSMTSAMAGKLIKLDMNVDTRELSKVVSMLKNIELKMTKDAFYAQGVNPTEDNINLYQEVSAKVNAIGKAPAAVVATPLMGEAFTIEGLHNRIAPIMAMEDGAFEGQTGQDSASQSGATGQAVISGQLETVRRSYEAVGTVPRRDMGDSIAKAFSNVQDILQEMNMPVNYETERAVRILGYNQLQITEGNINQIIDYDRQVNDMLNTFYPEAVIGMIKDGINPLDMPINELNKKIRERNYNAGVTEAKNFATYLRDMEKHGEVTPEEREAYVGMYRVMEKLSKSGDREAGYLFANGSRLTVRNLITAMRSRKAVGVDVGIDDSFGMLQDLTVKGKRMDEQIEGAFSSKPGTLDNLLGVSSRQPMFTEFKEPVSDEYVTDITGTMNKLDGSIEEFMVDNSVEISAVNIRAVDVMLSQPGSMYSLVSELLSKMKFSTNTKAELIDEEIENMAASMSGEDVPVDIADFDGQLALDSILEHFRGSEEMSLRYEDLRANLTELMYQWGAVGTLTQMDIATIKTVNAGFNIMSAMAKQDKFQIPVETDQGTKVMNLTIKKNGDNPGLVAVSMVAEDYGEISAAVKCDKNGALIGQLISDSSDGNFALQRHEDRIKGALAKAGYDAEAVSVGTVSQTDLMTVAGITDEKLYQVSVAVVKAIAGIV